MSSFKDNTIKVLWGWKKFQASKKHPLNMLTGVALVGPSAQMQLSWTSQVINSVHFIRQGTPHLNYDYKTDLETKKLLDKIL